MESTVNWATSQLSPNIPILWSTHELQQDLIEGNYSMPYITSSSVLNHQMQEMHKGQTGQLYPTCEIMSMMQLPNTNLEETLTTSQSYPSLSTTSNSFVPNFNMAHQNQQQVLFNATQQNNKVTCSDLESLDCLLSSTTTNSNTNTDTSLEDDGIISMILSDCSRNLSYGRALSSADQSVSNTNNASNSNASNNKDMHTAPASHQCSSDQYVIDSKVISSTKRTSTNDQYYEMIKDPYLSTIQNCSATEGGFKLIISENNIHNPPKSKKPRWEKKQPCSSTNINFQQPNSSSVSALSQHSNIIEEEPDPEAIAQMKEMIYRAAAFRPVNLLGLEEVLEKPKKRKNVRISSDPQTVAARQRRERISERIRVLQKIVPGGSKMDTASMLDEAANYLKFLKSQIKALESLGGNKLDPMNCSPPTTSFAFSFNNNPSLSTFPPMQTHFPIQNHSHINHSQG